MTILRGILRETSWTIHESVCNECSVACGWLFFRPDLHRLLVVTSQGMKPRLVGGLEHEFYDLGMSSSQPTNSYFSGGLCNITWLVNMAIHGWFFIYEAKISWIMPKEIATSWGTEGFITMVPWPKTKMDGSLGNSSTKMEVTSEICVSCLCSSLGPGYPLVKVQTTTENHHAING